MNPALCQGNCWLTIVVVTDFDVQQPKTVVCLPLCYVFHQDRGSLGVSRRDIHVHVNPQAFLAFVPGWLEKSEVVIAKRGCV